MLRINPYAGHLILFLPLKIAIYRHKEPCDRRFTVSASCPADPPKAGEGSAFAVANKQRRNPSAHFKLCCFDRSLP
jgi:hypothetical protein